MSASKTADLRVQTERDAIEHYDVFISYRRGTCGGRNIDDLAEKIQLQLMLKGLRVFVDKSGIPVGDTWRVKFMTDLKLARVIILVVTHNTMRRYERPKTDIVSILSGMITSGVQALAEPVVSFLAPGAGGESQRAPSSSSSTDSVDNVLLEWMLAMSLKKEKIIIPLFIGDSDPATGNVGGLLEQGVLQNLSEPPAHVIDATRAYASAFLASECDPPVLLADCCASLSSLIKDGIGALNGVPVKSVAWEIVPAFAVSQVLQSPLLRDLLDALTPKKATASPLLDRFLSSEGSPQSPAVKNLLSAFESSPRTAETLYESCFLRTQFWPHVTQQKFSRRRNTIGFSLFIAEPVDLRGASVDLFPPSSAESFYVYITRGENPECREFVQTWKDDSCTLQLPYIHRTFATLSRHHATLHYCGDLFKKNGIGLADGHFNPRSAFVPSDQSELGIVCPCGLPNPHGKTCSEDGTSVLSYPPAGQDKERRVIMTKRVLTATDAHKKNLHSGGFVTLDGSSASFMYFVLSNVVLGISNPMTTIEQGAARMLHRGDSLPTSPPTLSSCPQVSASDSSVLPPKYEGPTSPPNTRNLSSSSPNVSRSHDPDALNATLEHSLNDGTVNGMEQGGWEKISTCWKD
jgi:hypothetical protein